MGCPGSDFLSWKMPPGGGKISIKPSHDYRGSRLDCKRDFVGTFYRAVDMNLYRIAKRWAATRRKAPGAYPAPGASVYPICFFRYPFTAIRRFGVGRGLLLRRGRSSAPSSGETGTGSSSGSGSSAGASSLGRAGCSSGMLTAGRSGAASGGAGDGEGCSAAGGVEGWTGSSDTGTAGGWAG